MLTRIEHFYDEKMKLPVEGLRREYENQNHFVSAKTSKKYV